MGLSWRCVSGTLRKTFQQMWLPKMVTLPEVLLVAVMGGFRLVQHLFVGQYLDLEFQNEQHPRWHILMATARHQEHWGYTTLVLVHGGQQLLALLFQQQRSGEPTQQLLVGLQLQVMLICLAGGGQHLRSYKNV